MYLTNTGAAMRHAAPSRPGAMPGEPQARTIAWPPMLSPLELRQLVAAMVD